MAENIAREGRRASTILKTLSNEDRTEALQLIYDALKANKDEILKANKLDLEDAEKNNLSNTLVGRLNLAKGDKFDSMVQGVLDVAHLPDPIGKTTLATKIDDGLELTRVTCPVGVLLVIFESRPEVIANIASLALKSGNAAILKAAKNPPTLLRQLHLLSIRPCRNQRSPQMVFNLLLPEKRLTSFCHRTSTLILSSPEAATI